jgi:hypothetical protein
MHVEHLQRLRFNSFDETLFINQTGRTLAHSYRSLAPSLDFLFLELFAITELRDRAFVEPRILTIFWLMDGKLKLFTAT